MKIFFMLIWIALLTFNSAIAQAVIEIPINENTLQESQWRKGGEKSWFYNRTEKCLDSGTIQHAQSSWIEFTKDTGEGIISFTYKISSELNCDYLRFYIDNKPIFFNSGEIEILTYSSEISAGQHTFRWVYLKDTSFSKGSDNVKIYQIQYTPSTFKTANPKIPDINIKEESYNKENLEISDLSFFEGESYKSWGNGDRIVQNFEVVEIQGEILEKTHDLKAENYIIEANLPTNILLVHAPQITKSENSKKLAFSFSIVVNNNYNGKKIILEINLKGKNSNNIIITKNFEVPFMSIDLSKRYLQQEKILQTKKFDYNSKEELDNFLKLYPNSEFVPALFRFRLEYCRRFRDQKLLENNSLVSSSQDKKLSEEQEKTQCFNIIAAINEYHEFIEKYPDRILTRIAIQECFELHVKVNRLSLYYNFIHRYPHTEQSLVAKEYIRTLLFALVCTENTVSAYEKFIELYPEHSFYREKCIKLAIQKSIEDEQIFWNKSNSNKLDEMILYKRRNERANELVQELYKIRKEYNTLPISERFKKAANDIRIQRIKQIIEEVYNDTHAMNTILLWDEIRDIAALNQGMQEHLTKQTQQLQQNMENYFVKLQQNLDKNFTEIYKRFDKVDEKLAKIENRVELVQQNLTDLKNHVQNLHEDLQALHKDMNTRFDKIDTKLESIDTHLQEGFARIDAKLDTGFATINNHFKTLHNDLTQINQGILKLDTGLTTLSEQNREFLNQNAKIMVELQKNSAMYTGYEPYPRNTNIEIAGGIVGSAIMLGVECIPVAGPIVSRIAAPACNWLGEKICGATVSLWKAIF